MKTVLFLVYLSFVGAIFTSGVERYSFAWAALVWTVVVLFVAAIFRLHAVINAPKEDQ